MALVKRANVELTVKDELVDFYLSKGYDEINEDGSVIRRAELHTLESYKQAYMELKQKYDVLKEAYEKLKDEADVFKAVAEETEAEETEVKETKRGRSKK